VDGAEVAALVRPLVPDADAVLLEVLDVGVAGEEPEQLVDDRLQMQLLGGQQREAVAEIEAHLMAEHGQSAGAGAVALLDAVIENPLHQFEVLAHGGPHSDSGPTWGSLPRPATPTQPLSTPPRPLTAARQGRNLGHRDRRGLRRGLQ